MQYRALSCFILLLGVTKADRTYSDEPYDVSDLYDDTLLSGGSLENDFGYGPPDALEGLQGTKDSKDSNYYYHDEYDLYYKQFGIYADAYGSDYFDSESKPVCEEDSDGVANMTEPACDIKISGADKYLKSLEDGLDGVYKLSGCFDGMPKYERSINGKKNSTRLLWRSSIFKDWDISIGPHIVMTQSILYGASSGSGSRPNFVAQDAWRLKVDYIKKQYLKSEDQGIKDIRVNVTVTCAGSNNRTRAAPAKEPVKSTTSQSLLTDDEADASYREVYKQYSPGEPGPGINFAMVILMLMIGSGLVMGVPYLLQRKQSDGKTLAQVLEAARKQRQGHVN